jgi:hypothetical protein
MAIPIRPAEGTESAAINFIMCAPPFAERRCCPQGAATVVEEEDLPFPGSLLIQVADEIALAFAAMTASTFDRRACCGSLRHTSSVPSRCFGLLDGPWRLHEHPNRSAPVGADGA